jgi:hypothetical protein
MRSIVVLAFSLLISVRSYSAEVIPGFYTCQGHKDSYQGTATFKVTHINLPNPNDDYLPVFYVEANYQGETANGKEMYALRGIADVLTDAMGGRHLMLGNSIKSLILTIQNQTAYTQIGPLKMDCRFAR